MQKIHGTIQDIATIGNHIPTGEFGHTYSHQIRIQDIIYFLNPDEAQLKILQSTKLNNQSITLSIPYNGLIETIYNHTTQEKFNTPIPEHGEHFNKFMEIYFLLLIFLAFLSTIYFAL